MKPINNGCTKKFCASRGRIIYSLNTRAAIHMKIILRNFRTI